MQQLKICEQATSINHPISFLPSIETTEDITNP